MTAQTGYGIITLHYMQREFTAVYQKQGKHYIAWVEEVPGANTEGRTKQEARENLREAVALILTTGH